MALPKSDEPSNEMSADTATKYVRTLVQNECQGWGDLEPAMHRLEQRYGLPFWTTMHFWKRKAKTVDARMFARIRAAYLAHCERQLLSIQHTLRLEEAADQNAVFEDLLAEAESLVAKVQQAKAACRR